MIMNADTAGIDRSSDATLVATVMNAGQITQTNSSTSTPPGTNDWSGSVWNFGMDGERPVLKWITGFDNAAVGDAKYSCDQSLLPPGQMCGGIIPGPNTDRTP